MRFKLFQPGPMSFSDYILSFLFVGMGLLFTYLFGKVGVLSCTRAETQPKCAFQTSWMGLVTLNQRSIATLRGAEVQESCDNDGCTYRVVIQTSTETIPLEEAYSSGQGDKEDIANQVNDFVKNTSLRSVNVSAGGGFFLIIPLAFVAVGVFLALKPLLGALQAIFNRG